MELILNENKPCLARILLCDTKNRQRIKTIINKAPDLSEALF